MKRLFVAIKITPDEKLLAVYSNIRKMCRADKIKWVDENLFHLTLKFLGETHKEEIDKISLALQRIAESTPAFSFDLMGIGIFGSSYHPRVIHVNIDNVKKLKQLGHRVLDEMDRVGFPRDRQNFVPHLTLGRIRVIRSKPLFQKTISLYKEVYLQKVSVHEIVLYESILRPQSPVYTVLNRYKLS